MWGRDYIDDDIEVDVDKNTLCDMSTNILHKYDRIFRVNGWTVKQRWVGAWGVWHGPPVYEAWYKNKFEGYLYKEEDIKEAERILGTKYPPRVDERRRGEEAVEKQTWWRKFFE